MINYQIFRNNKTSFSSSKHLNLTEFWEKKLIGNIHKNHWLRILEILLLGDFLDSIFSYEPVNQYFSKQLENLHCIQIRRLLISQILKIKS